MLARAGAAVTGAVLAGLSLAWLTSCQTPPTRVVETQVRPFDVVTAKLGRPLELSDETTLLDARSAFDYGLNHVENSHLFSWNDLCENAKTGEPMRDLHRVGLRLALAGLSRNAQIVAVGDGVNGQGDEGQLAWMLLYFGLNDVQVASVEVFRKNWSRGYTPPARNVAQWKVVPRDELVLEPAQFKAMVDAIKSQNPAGHATSSGGKAVKVIDVSDKEGLATGSSNGPVGAFGSVEIGRLHLSWREFYSRDGRPSAAVRGKLESLGVQVEDRIVIVAQKVSQAGAAAYALLALGYSNVQRLRVQAN